MNALFAQLMTGRTFYLGVRTVLLIAFLVAGTTACASGTKQPVSASKRAQSFGQTKTIEETRTVSINFETIERDDPTIPEGEKRFQRDGKKGRTLVAYKVKYTDCQEQSLTVVDITTLEGAVDEIILIGTLRIETSTPELIPFETQNTDDPNMLKGASVVWRKGTNGERVKVYEVGYKDGREVSRTFIRKVMTKEPVAKVVANGIK